jgi:hypothetical protein
MYNSGKSGANRHAAVKTRQHAFFAAVFAVCIDSLSRLPRD